jgi:peptide/nickel transport system substrate-binding protein
MILSYSTVTGICTGIGTSDACRIIGHGADTGRGFTGIMGNDTVGASDGSGQSVKPGTGRHRSRFTILVVVIVIILIVAGSAVYAIYGTHKPVSKLAAVSPSSSFSFATIGSPITFYTNIQKGVSVKSIQWNFGNGQIETFSGSAGNSVSYSYPSAGNYLVLLSVETLSGAVITNAAALLEVSVIAGPNMNLAPLYPANILISSSSANQENISVGALNIVPAGGYVNFTSALATAYSAYPTAAGWQLNSTVFNFLGKNYSYNSTDVSNGVNSVNVTVPSPGIYPAVMSAVTNNSTVSQTWKFVQTIAAGNYSLKHAISGSSSRGIVDAEWLPGGFTSLDPAILYQLPSYETDYEFYQPLVNFAPGSSFSDFQPVLATSVPSTSNGLLSSQTKGGITYTNMTFNLRSNLRFSNGDPVTPYDVWFSVTRSILFANEPGMPGWLVAHALIPGASIYGPFNITPFWIDKAITYNQTSVTFHLLPTTNQSLYGVPALNGTNAAYFATGSVENSSTAYANGYASSQYDSYGSADYFMQILTQPVGFVIDASWAAQNGAGLSSNTSASYYAYQRNALPSNWNTKLQFSEMGTGPYVVSSEQPGTSISFTLNKYYIPPPGYPAAASMAPTVTIYYYTSESIAQEAFISGTADFAEYAFPPASTPTVLSMIKAGEAGAISSPQPAVWNFFYNLQINVSGLTALGYKNAFPSSTIYSVNGYDVSTFLGNLSVRRTLTYAFNQSEYLSMNNVSGIAFAKNEAGYIPSGIQDYPSNITNLSSNPWLPYYDMKKAMSYWNTTAFSSLAKDSVVLPIFNSIGNAVQDAMITDYWIPAIEAATGGVVQPYLVDVNPSTISTLTTVSSSQNPIPIYYDGWVADYADPSDFAGPFVLPYGIYSYPDGLFQGVGFNSSTNPHQWKLIQEMWNATISAFGETNTTQRILDYYESSYLYSQLDLAVGIYQSVGVLYYRSWINPSSLTWSLAPGIDALTWINFFGVQKS